MYRAHVLIRGRALDLGDHGVGEAPRDATVDVQATPPAPRACIVDAAWRGLIPRVCWAMRFQGLVHDHCPKGDVMVVVD